MENRNKLTDQSSERGRREYHKDGETLPALYSIFRGQVASVQQYGAFVKMPFCKKQGLVHRSQISATKVEKPEDVLDIGEEVWCKVINVDSETSKVGLSMKVVNQTTGKDMDPNHVQTALDEQRRKKGVSGESKKIELGAIFDTTCRKCGGKGHLAQDCFHQEGGEKYDLVPDWTFMMDQAKKELEDPPASKHKHKKQKKEKKKKKRDHSSDSTKAKKKHKKEKAKKRKSTHKSDSSDSSDSSEVDNRPKPQKPANRSRRDSSSDYTDSDDPNSRRYKLQQRSKMQAHESPNAKRHKSQESPQRSRPQSQKPLDSEGGSNRFTQQSPQRSRMQSYKSPNSERGSKRCMQESPQEPRMQSHKSPEGNTRRHKSQESPDWRRPQLQISPDSRRYQPRPGLQQSHKSRQDLSSKSSESERESKKYTSQRTRRHSSSDSDSNRKQKQKPYQLTSPNRSRKYSYSSDSSDTDKHTKRRKSHH